MSELGAGPLIDRVEPPARSRWITRRRLFEVLEASAKGDATSRVVDAVLVTLIVVNVVCAALESVPSLYARFGTQFVWLEIVSVTIFSLEYVLRLLCAVEHESPRYKHPVWGRVRYAFSGLALIDLVAILPFYLAASTGIDLRTVRTLRLLRVLKLSHYFSALGVLLDVIRTERAAFGAAYFLIALGISIASTGVYIAEHDAQPEAFGSVPAALYWSIVTLTTVGYGDVVPITTFGRLLGAVVMILGVGMLAIPTGILATGFTLELRRRRDRAEAGANAGAVSSCPNCGFQAKSQNVAFSSSENSI